MTNSTPNILLIGANGNTCRAIIPHLKARGANIRGLASNPDSARALEDIGVEAIVGDFRSEDSLRAAMKDTDRVFHTTPPLMADEHQVGRNVIGAAKSAGVPHIVFHSLILPHIERIGFHWEKLKVQIDLRESGLAYTILQPTSYLQNIGWAWNAILESGKYILPYSEHQELTWVDMHDFAEAAANVLTEGGHEYATYETVGTAPLSRVELCEIISRVIGKNVTAGTVDIDEFFQLPQWQPFDDYELGTFRDMLEDVDEHGLRSGGTKVLEWLLGRKPVTLEEFFERFAAAPEIMTWHHAREGSA